MCDTGLVLGGYQAVTSSYSALNEVSTTPTLGCSAEKYRPGVTAEVMKSRDTECSVEEHGQGVIRDGAQAVTGDPLAINNSLMVR